MQGSRVRADRKAGLGVPGRGSTQYWPGSVSGVGGEQVGHSVEDGAPQAGVPSAALLGPDHSLSALSDRAEDWQAQDEKAWGLPRQHGLLVGQAQRFLLAGVAPTGFNFCAWRLGSCVLPLGSAYLPLVSSFKIAHSGRS